MRYSVRKLRRRARAIQRGEVDPFQFFVADLAVTFVKHFGLEATVLGPASLDTTPFIAFVIAVCEEGKITYPETGRLPTKAQVSDIGRLIGLPEEGEA